MSQSGLPEIQVRREGKILHVIIDGEERVSSFYAGDPDRTTRGLDKTWKDLFAGKGKKLRSYLLAKHISPLFRDANETDDTTDKMDHDISQPSCAEARSSTVNSEGGIKRIAGKASKPTAVYAMGHTYDMENEFDGRLQITAQGTPKSRPFVLEVVCKAQRHECNCAFHKSMTLDFNQLCKGGYSAGWPSALATFFDTNNPLVIFKVFAEFGLQVCRTCILGTQLEFTFQQERAITPGQVMDMAGNTSVAWFACSMEKTPTWIVAKGWIARAKEGKIGILVVSYEEDTEIQAPSTEVVEQCRKIVAEEASKCATPFDFVFKVADALRRKWGFKGGDVTKGIASDLMTIASPIWIVTPEGSQASRQLGATTAEIGITTTGKSSRMRNVLSWAEITDNSYQRGSKSSAGLYGGIENIEGIGFAVKKGIFPRHDLGVVFLDNASPQHLGEFIESRRDGVVQITKIRQGAFFARCRLKLVNNPILAPSEASYACQALNLYRKIDPFTENPALIARLAFATISRPASNSERYSEEKESVTSDEEILLDALKQVLRYNLAAESQVEISSSTPEWEAVLKKSKELDEMYGCDEIPILTRNVPYKLVLAASTIATICGAVRISLSSIEAGWKRLDYCARDIELDKFVPVYRQQSVLTDQEYPRVEKSWVDKLHQENPLDIRESISYKVADFLFKHGEMQLDELVARVSAAGMVAGKDAVQDRAKWLKGMGMLNSGRLGYKLSAKGTQFFRIWFSA